MLPIGSGAVHLPRDLNLGGGSCPPAGILLAGLICLRNKHIR